MKGKGGCQVVDATFLVYKNLAFKILKRGQNTEGNNDPDSCLFRFIGGLPFDQAPNNGKIPNAR